MRVLGRRLSQGEGLCPASPHTGRPGYNPEDLLRERRGQELDWGDRCIGIAIGSIVEGSDVEVGPEYLAFPFTDEQLDEVVKGINDEGSFYWERDNSRWYVLQHDGGAVAGIHIAWDDPVWEKITDVDIPVEIVERVNKLLREGELPLVNWQNCEQVTDLGVGWKLVEYVNDGEF